jgi:thiol-disulfide isomerase/thioredoxin
LVAATLARVRESGKVALFKVSGAWCPPCQLLSKLIEQSSGSPETKAILDAYEIVEIEEQHLLDANLSSFLPFQVQFYPSLVVFHPASNTWSLLLVESDEVQLRERLGAFAADRSAIASGFASLDRALQFKDKKALDPLYSLPLAFALELDRASGEKQLERLVSWVKENSLALQALAVSADEISDFASSAQLDFTRALVSAGKMTRDELARVRKAELTAARADFGGQSTLTGLLFTSPLTHVLRTQGLPAAAKACGEYVLDLEDRYAPVPGVLPRGATAEEARSLREDNEALAKAFLKATTDRVSTCILLSARAGLANAKGVKAYGDGFSDKAVFKEKTINAHKLARIHAAVGDFARAGSLERAYLNDYLAASEVSLKGYDERIARKEVALAKAKESGDASAILLAQLDLDTEKEWREGKALTKVSMPTAIELLIGAYARGVLHPSL